LNLAQACNSLGTTIAPYLGGLFILSAASMHVEELRQMPAAALQAYRLHEASSVKLPYLGLSLLLIALGVVIAKFKFPVIASATPMKPRKQHTRAYGYRHFVLGAIGIFVYVGAEVSIGGFLVNYFSQPNIGHISEKTASGLVSFYWGCAMIGRFVGAAVLQKLWVGLR
jgi:MFS transporter, FHS family, L-fucose permease